MSKDRSISQKSQQSIQALAVLNRLGQLVTVVQDPSKILKQIATEAKNVLGADIVDLYEYNQARQKFVTPPTLFGDRRHPEVSKNEIYEDDVAAKVVKAGAPQYFPDAQHTALLTADFDVHREDAPENRFVVREDVVSSASLPLKAGKEIVGVMFVNFRTHQKFEDEQKDLIESFSNLAAIAIYNSRLWKLQTTQVVALKEIIDVIGTKEEPLSAILNQTVRLFSVNNGSISRLTENGQFIQHKVRWSSGKLENDIKEDSLPVSKGITGYVVRTGLPFRTGDVSKVKFYDPWYSTTKSEMAIPLKNVFGGVVGVLNIESDFANFFSEEDEKLCESFAHAASAAIQQSDLIEDIQSLHYLTESHTLKDLLDRVLNGLIKLLGENTAASINLYDSANDDFYAFGGVGPSQEFVNQYLLIPPRKNGTGRYVLKTKSPLYYEDVNNIPSGLPKIRPESIPNEIASFAVLPLIYQERIVGTLFIHKIRERLKFTVDAQRILETYASQAALAIHNAQRLIDIEPLKTILSATISGNRETILRLIVERAVDIMASDYASIWMPEHGTGDLVSQAIYIKPDEQEAFIQGGTRIKSDRASINMTVYRSREPIIVNDVDFAEKEFRYNRIYKKARSEIAVPLIFGNEIIGTLNTESRYPGAYSEFDKATLRIFADIAAAAIEIHRRNAEIQHQREELSHMNYHLEHRNASFEALTEIGQQLTANVQRSEREILSIIHQQASHIMDTDNMYIALYEPDKDLVRFQLAFLDGNPVDVKTEKGWEPRSGGNGRTEWIVRHKAPILNYTRADSQEWYKQPGAQEYIGETFASWLGVPIMFGNEVLGVVATYHKTKEYIYGPDDLKILSLMGRQAAIALQNARLIRKLDIIRELGDDLSQGALSS